MFFLLFFQLFKRILISFIKCFLNPIFEMLKLFAYFLLFVYKLLYPTAIAIITSTFFFLIILNPSHKHLILISIHETNTFTIAILIYNPTNVLVSINSMNFITVHYHRRFHSLKFSNLLYYIFKRSIYFPTNDSRFIT